VAESEPEGNPTKAKSGRARQSPLPHAEVARKNDPGDPVVIYERWCKGCGICVTFCPMKVLGLNGEGKAVVAKGDVCTRCQLCELHCPDFAVTVHLR
jgi:2-oxoglutarate ferredoxin oxidoreductase subunit delta